MRPEYDFQLDVRLNAIACEIVVNDVPVLRNYTPARLDTEVPVTEFIVPGQNQLVVRVLTDLSEVGMSATRAAVRLRSARRPGIDWLDIMTVSTRGMAGAPSADGDGPAVSALGPVSAQVELHEPSIRVLNVGRSLQLAAASPAWNWSTSPVIPEVPELVGNLAGWYQWFYSAVEARNAGVVTQQLAEKVAELAPAYELSPAETLGEIGIVRALADPLLRLRQVDWTNLLVERAANGRLVRLYHPAEGAIIAFDDDVGLRHTFDFWLRLERGAWIVAR